MDAIGTVNRSPEHLYSKTHEIGAAHEKCLVNRYLSP